MLTRFFSLFSALYLALPMYWCCMVQAMPAETKVEAACPSCLESSSPSGQHPGCPGQDCPFCAKLVKRNVSPDSAVAPGAVLVDLQTPVWEQPLPLLPFFERVPDAWKAALARAVSPPNQPPLYHQHCSLLI